MLCREAVTDTADGFDMATGITHFLAEPCYLDVNGTLSAAVIVAVNSVNELIP